ncbi:MAG: FAD-dependent oxidoreductase [Spartobacteria bacterium]|nr:FAD-dependent oxidoreductase [Spartobacteria bacterium]
MTNMQDFEREQFDVLIVGGGIQGASLAWAAAAAGLSVALIEKGDFGEAASANSLKIMHGGLRYLQQVDLPRMRESIVARRMSFQLMPHLVHPTSFMVPSKGFLLQSPLAYLAAGIANDMISFDRNQGVPASHRIPMIRLKAKSFLAQVAEPLADMGSGAMLWQDGFVENTERFTMSLVMSAEQNGAVIANYVKADHLLRAAGRIEGVAATEVESGREFEIRARTTVLATGGWLPELEPEECRSCHAPWEWTRGYNVVIRRNLFGMYGVGLESRMEYLDRDAVMKRGKRNYFFAPWHGGTMIGTLYKPHDASADLCGVQPEEIESVLAEVNSMYPAAELTMDDVCFAQAGILPGKPSADGKGSDDPARDTEVIDYEEKAGISGLIAIKGVKYTTALIWGQRVAKMLAHKHKEELNPVPLSVYGGEQCPTAEMVSKETRGMGGAFSDETCAYLAQQYGGRYLDVLRCAQESDDWDVIAETCIPVAVIPHAIQREHARRLADVVFRRTDMGSFCFPGREALEQTARCMASQLGWTDPRVMAEINDVEDQYRRLGVEHVLSV